MIFSLCLKEPSDASLDALWLEYIANSEDEEDANSILDGMRKMGLGGLRHCDEMMTSRYSGKSVKQAARNNKKIKITTSPPEGEEDKKESPFFRYHPILKYLIEVRTENILLYSHMKTFSCILIFFSQLLTTHPLSCRMKLVMQWTPTCSHLSIHSIFLKKPLKSVQIIQRATRDLELYTP